MTEADFQSLYEQHRAMVWAVAFARRHEAELATDIVQETFFRFWQEVRAGANILSPKSWLARVARNLAEDERKSAFSRNGTQGPDSMVPLRDRQPGPQDHALAAEARDLVRRMLRELSPVDREILTLRYAFDLETEAIARELELSVTAVHMRLSRARHRLADKLREENRDE